MARYDIPSTYGAADTFLGKRDTRNVCNNTRIRRAQDSIVLRHWHTDIVTHRRDGWTVVTCDGWHTVTTMARVNGAMPGPFGIRSAGKRGSFLYASGYAICPDVNGIAVNASTGAVGILDGDTVRVLFTAEDIADVMAAEDARRKVRDDCRAARILREHPEVRPITYRDDVAHSAHYGHETPLPNPHRVGSWRAARECERCRAERDAWADIRRPVLVADHATGHAVSGTFAGPNGGTWTQAAVRVWDCPECKYGYGTRY